jgi:hypothetical protein
MMKKLMSKAGLFLAIITAIMGCDKHEQILQHDEKEANLLALDKYTPALVVNNKGKYFKAIDTICSTYIDYSRQVETFGVDPETWGHQIGYFRSLLVTWEGDTGFFLRLPEPGTWFSNWNSPPYVETNNPMVLLPQLVHQTLILSKNCYVFGFEMSAKQSSANNKPVTYRITYATGDQPGDVIGYIENTVSSPAGARLFAVESEIPFNRVTIDYSPSTENNGQDAMANLRYVINKEVFDAHK